MDIYVDNYITLAIVQSKAELDHIANTTMRGMHSVFPASAIDISDPISEKKMIKKDDQWRVEKGLLDWTFEGLDKTMGLEEDKIKGILPTLKSWC